MKENRKRPHSFHLRLSDEEYEKLQREAKMAGLKPQTYIHKVLKKDGVTLNLLWLEYCEACRKASEPVSVYTVQQVLHNYVAKTSATMHLYHKPSEIIAGGLGR